MEDDDANGGGSWVDKALAQIDDLTPTSGYNVIGVDTFEMPGEGAYFVRHFTERDEAEAFAEEMRTLNPEDRFHVYGSED